MAQPGPVPQSAPLPPAHHLDPPVLPSLPPMSQAPLPPPSLIGHSAPLPHAGMSQTAHPPPSLEHGPNNNGLTSFVSQPPVPSNGQPSARGSIDRHGSFSSPPASASSLIGLPGQHNGAFDWPDPNMANMPGSAPLPMINSLHPAGSIPSTPAAYPTQPRQPTSNYYNVVSDAHESPANGTSSSTWYSYATAPTQSPYHAAYPTGNGVSLHAKRPHPDDDDDDDGDSDDGGAQPARLERGPSSAGEPDHNAHKRRKTLPESSSPATDRDSRPSRSSTHRAKR